MRIVTKTNRINNQDVDLFNNILSDLDDLDERYIKEVIICEADKIESYAKEIDKEVSVTKFYGSNILAKTIPLGKKSTILLSTIIIRTILENVSRNSMDELRFDVEGIESLKTIFHEFGHAKNTYLNGHIRVKKEVSSFDECIREYWKLLRDEYIAEKFSANVYKIDKIYDYEENCYDIEEKNNFFEYLTKYVKKRDLPCANLILQFLLFYYFMPLFKKTGLLEGMGKFTDLANIKVCNTISKLRKCNVIKNVSIPQQFEKLVNDIWCNFEISKILDIISQKNPCYKFNSHKVNNRLPYSVKNTA